MPVPNTMADLPTLAGSNSPQGTETVFPNLDDYIRSLSAIIRSTNAVSSSSIAAASTTNVSSSSGEYVSITGAATITSLGTGFAGCVRELAFAGICTLTHSSNLQLPGSANITTAVGDKLTFRCIAAGQWVLTSFSNLATIPAFANAVTLNTTQTISGAKTFSAQAAFSGINFGSVVAASDGDLSSHIALFGAGNGFNVRTGTVCAVVGGAQIAQFTATGIVSNGTISDAVGDVRKMGVVIANGSITLGAAHLNRVVEKSGTTAIAYTIAPALGTNSDAITIVNGNTNNLTVTRGVGVNLFRSGVNGDIVLPAGSMVTIYRAATVNTWIA